VSYEKIKSKTANVFEKSGIKNILILSSGVLIAQIIGFISMPITTRLYSVEAFGVLAIIVSMVSIFKPIITLQYHMGIVTANSDKQANVLSALTLIIIIICTIIVGLGLFITNLANPLIFSEVGLWIYAVVPLLFLTAIVQVIDSYNNRFGQYKLMASVHLQRAISSNAVKIILGYFQAGHWGLVISQLVSVTFGIKKQGQYIVTEFTQIKKTTLKELKEEAVKHKAQPLYSLPGLFVTTFSFSILPVFITSMYGIKEAGFFSVAMTVLGMPLTLISSNVARIFFKNADLEIKKCGDFRKTFQSTSLLLSILSFSGFTLLWFSIEPLFAILYGEKWITSGTYIKILIPMFAIRLVVSSLMHGFIVSGKQSLKLGLQFLFIISSLTTFTVTNMYNLTIDCFLEIINISYSLIYIVLFLVLYISSKNKINNESRNDNEGS